MLDEVKGRRIFQGFFDFSDSRTDKISTDCEKNEVFQSWFYFYSGYG